MSDRHAREREVRQRQDACGVPHAARVHRQGRSNFREGLRSFPGGHQGQRHRPRPLLLRRVPQRAHEAADALRRAGHHRLQGR